MKFLEFNVFNNSIQDYLISIGIIIVAIVCAAICNRILKRFIISWAQRTRTDLDDLVVKRVLLPLTYFVVVLGLAAAKSHLQLPDVVSFWLNKFLVVLGFVIFFLIVIRFLQGFVEIAANAYIRRLKEKKPENLDDQLHFVDRVKKQVREISTMVIALIAILTILSNIGVDLKAIWASLGIGGIALVVAVQEPLRNLVGRVYIFSTGIFDEGHFIIFNNYAGTVTRIAMFRTYMELFSDMTTVSIPNADFVKGPVKSYHGRTSFMYKWDLDVPYEVSPERIQDLILKLRALLESKPEVNREVCWVYLQRLDRYSKVVRTWFQVSLPSWSDSLFYGNQMLHEIQLLFESLDISFAFPTQTLHLKTESPLDDRERIQSVPVVLPEVEEGKGKK